MKKLKPTPIPGAGKPAPLRTLSPGRLKGSTPPADEPADGEDKKESKAKAAPPDK